MVFRCVVFGCGNIPVEREVSLHAIPPKTEKKRHAAWTKFVCRTRNHWKPTDSCHICSKHFLNSDFANKIQYDMGLATKLLLKKDAVPSIYPVVADHELSTASGSATGSSMCVAKGNANVRSAVRKREASRILDTLPVNMDEPAAVEDSSTEIHSDVSLPPTRDVGTQYDPPPLRMKLSRSITTQTRGTDIKKSKGTQSMQQSDPATNVSGEKSNPVSMHVERNVKTPKFHTSTPKKRKLTPDSFEEPDSPVDEVPTEADTSYQPRSFVETSDSDSDETSKNSSYHEEEKYVVSKSCLWKLFDTCGHCLHPCAVTSHRKGSMITMKQHCPNCVKDLTWCSQPLVNNIPVGNLQLSAAILFTGMSYTKVLRMLNAANIMTISPSTYKDHKQHFLEPTIWNVWVDHRQQLVEQLLKMDDGLVLGGDGRADSPGHSAKYGSYTMMELRVNKVLNIELVQSNEVANSNAMEKEGLIRCIQFLKESDLDIAMIITDRHPQIQKYLREQVDCQHYYDVWHVAKGFSRNVEKLAKTECPELRPWIRSISNHMYWSAASSVGKGPEVIKAKWQSLSNHIQNKHVGHGKLFPKCLHDAPTPGIKKRKEWLKPSSKSCEKLTELIDKPKVLKDVMKLSPGQQTSNVEAFHSLIIQFAPKSVHFAFLGMLTSTALQRECEQITSAYQRRRVHLCDQVSKVQKRGLHSASKEGGAHIWLCGETHVHAVWCSDDRCPAILGDLGQDQGSGARATLFKV